MKRTILIMVLLMGIGSAMALAQDGAGIKPGSASVAPSPASPVPWDDAVKRGDAAFSKSDYPAALSWYTEAFGLGCRDAIVIYRADYSVFWNQGPSDQTSIAFAADLVDLAVQYPGHPYIEAARRRCLADGRLKKHAQLVVSAVDKGAAETSPERRWMAISRALIATLPPEPTFTRVPLAVGNEPSAGSYIQRAFGRYPEFEASESARELLVAALGKRNLSAAIVLFGRCSEELLSSEDNAECARLFFENEGHDVLANLAIERMQPGDVPADLATAYLRRYNGEGRYPGVPEYYLELMDHSAQFARVGALAMLERGLGQHLVRVLGETRRSGEFFEGVNATVTDLVARLRVQDDAIRSLITGIARYGTVLEGKAMPAPAPGRLSPVQWQAYREYLDTFAYSAVVAVLRDARYVELDIPPEVSYTPAQAADAKRNFGDTTTLIQFRDDVKMMKRGEFESAAEFEARQAAKAEELKLYERKVKAAFPARVALMQDRLTAVATARSKADIADLSLPGKIVLYTYNMDSGCFPATVTVNVGGQIRAWTDMQAELHLPTAEAKAFKEGGGPGRVAVTVLYRWDSTEESYLPSRISLADGGKPIPGFHVSPIAVIRKQKGSEDRILRVYTFADDIASVKVTRFSNLVGVETELAADSKGLYPIPAEEALGHGPAERVTFKTRVQFTDGKKAAAVAVRRDLVGTETEIVAAGTFDQPGLPARMRLPYALEVMKYEASSRQFIKNADGSMSASPYNILWDGVGAGDYREPMFGVAFIDALRFANLRSSADGLTPCYDLSSFDASGVVHCDFSADGWRLPTMAEWYWIASGGRFGHGYPYAGSADASKVGWFRNSWIRTVADVRDGPKKPYPSGQKAPNELGIYDLSGNVAEHVWIADRREDFAFGQTIKLDKSNHIEKYNTWAGGHLYEDEFSIRGYMGWPISKSPWLGFRFVRSIPQREWDYYGIVADW